MNGPDVTDPLNIDALLFADGAMDDTVLEVLDATQAMPTTPTTLRPADEVAVAAGNAAFLRGPSPRWEPRHAWADRGILPIWMWVIWSSTCGPDRRLVR